MDVTSTLSAAKTAFELARLLQNGLSTGQIRPEEVPARLMELQQHILSMQAIIHDLAEENRQLRHKLDDREAQKALDDDMDYQADGGFYVRKSEVGRKAIAYCPLCWKKDGRTVPLAVSSSIVGIFQCSLHQTEYKTAQGIKGEERFWRTANRPTVAAGPDSWMR
jgi:hypothetical protein